MTIVTDNFIASQSEYNNHIWIEEKETGRKSHISCDKKMTKEELEKYANDFIEFYRQLQNREKSQEFYCSKCKIKIIYPAKHSEYGVCSRCGKRLKKVEGNKNG